MCVSELLVIAQEEFVSMASRGRWEIKEGLLALGPGYAITRLGFCAPLKAVEGKFLSHSYPYSGHHLRRGFVWIQGWENHPESGRAETWLLSGLCSSGLALPLRGSIHTLSFQPQTALRVQTGSSGGREGAAVMSTGK